METLRLLFVYEPLNGFRRAETIEQLEQLASLTILLQTLLLWSFPFNYVTLRLLIVVSPSIFQVSKMK
jgi:hypothetical protein